MQVAVDSSPQAPLPLVQLLQVLNLASHYFGMRPVEDSAQLHDPALPIVPTEMPETETTDNWGLGGGNLTTSIFENEELNENGHSILRAVKDSNLTMVRRYLEKGANLEVVDGNGLSALHWAVLGDHVEITSVLLNHSADPNVRTSLQNTPLHRAARIGNFPACRYLIEYNADVNAVNSNGDTPLHEAARWGKDRVVALLLNHGADLTIPNNWGRIPVQEAESYKRTVVQKLLVEEEIHRNNLSVNVTDTREALPMWYLTNTSHAVQYSPPVPEFENLTTTPIPVTTSVFPTVSTTHRIINIVQKNIKDVKSSMPDNVTETML